MDGTGVLNCVSELVGRRCWGQTQDICCVYTKIGGG